MAADSPSAASSTSTQSPGASSSCSASPQVFFGRQRSQHELRTLAKLRATDSAWDAASTPIRKITKRDSREFHRRKTLLLSQPPTEDISSSGTKQWEGGLQEREDVFGGIASGSGSESDTISACSSTDSETELEDEQASPRPFSFTFSLRQSHSPSLSPASSISSSNSIHKLEDDTGNGIESHCDLTFDFDNFVFSDSPSKEVAVEGYDKDVNGPRSHVPVTDEVHPVITPVEEENNAGSEAKVENTPTVPETDELEARELQEGVKQEHRIDDLSPVEEQEPEEQTSEERSEPETMIASAEPIRQPIGCEEVPTVDELVSVVSPPSPAKPSAAVVNEKLANADDFNHYEVEESPASASASTEVVSETSSETTVVVGSNSPQLQETAVQERRTRPSAAELASMVADDNVGLAELAAAIAAINMGRPPASPDSDLDSPLPTFRAGPVIIPAILNRHPIRSPYQERPQSLPDFSPIRDDVPAPQLASMDSPTPASDLLSSPTVQAIASRSTPTSSMVQARTPTASQSNPPALAYPPKSKILKSSINVLSTPMQRPREKKADPREQAIRGQLNAAVHSIGQRTLGSSVAPMSVSRPTATAARSTPVKVQATPVAARTFAHKPTLASGVQATPRSMPPPVPSSISRPTLQAPASASRPVLAQLNQQRALQPIKTVSSAKPGRVNSQLPKVATKIPVIDAAAYKKPMPVPIALPARSTVGVSGRSVLALGAPSRLVGSRQVQSGSGRVLPSPARRSQAGREPVYSTYKPSNAFVFSACSISESPQEVCRPPSRQPSPQEGTSSRAEAGSSTAPFRMRASSDDASVIIPVAESSSPVKPPPAYEYEEVAPAPTTKTAADKAKKDAASKSKQARTTRPPRAAAKAANETLAPPAKSRRKPAVPIPSTVPNMSEKELATKTTLNTTRNEVYFCAINRIIVRKDGERPPSPTSKIRTVAEREEADKKGGRVKRAKRRRRSSEGLTSDEEEESAPWQSRDRHMRGPGETEDFVTPARPVKRTKLSPTAEARPSAFVSSSEKPEKPRISKYVTWDKGLVVIRNGSGRSSATGSSANEGLKSCLSLRGKPTLDQHGNLISTGKPLAEILKRTRIDVTAVFYDGEEPVPVKSTPKKKGKK